VRDLVEDGVPHQVLVVERDQVPGQGDGARVEPAVPEATDGGVEPEPPALQAEAVHQAAGEVGGLGVVHPGTLPEGGARPADR
jgi:hypothetical protein